MKKIFLILFILFNSNAYSVNINNRIVAKIDNQIISSFDLKNKIKTLLFFNNEELSQESINKTKPLAMRSLIDHKIKKEELLKYNSSLEKNNQNVNKYLANIALKYNTDTRGLKQIFQNNKIDYESYLSEIKVQLLWQKFIFDVYKDKIELDEKEINLVLNEIIKKKKKINDFKLAEIEIPHDNQNIEKIVADTQEQIKGIGFENTAIKFSISPSSLDGGNLDWVNSESLSKKIYEVISKMNVGEISTPIIKTDTIMFLKLLDKKLVDLNKMNFDEIKKNIINSKKNEMLNLFSNSHLSKLKNNKLIKIK